LQNKNTGNKGKKKGRQALLKAAKTQINDAVRICANTEDRESAVESLDVMAHMHSCNLSGTPLGHNEPCHDDTDKMLREDSPCVEEQEESGCSTIYSSDKAPSCDAKNLLTELGTFELSDNLGNPAKEDYSIQENQASDSVLLDSEEMPRHDCVDGESTHSCVDIYQEERVSTREDQTSEETLSVSHDHNDVGQEASLSLAEPSSIDEHAQSSANNFYYDYGEWRVVWDPFYSRYYFYNIQTQESTWCPPEGLEDFASYCSPDTTKELVELGSQCTSIAPQENSKNLRIFGLSL
jgi:trimethylguanosine synthase